MRCSSQIPISLLFSWTGAEMSVEQKSLNVFVYAPALVGGDEKRPLAIVHRMERALPGLRLEWTTSEKDDFIALRHRIPGPSARCGAAFARTAYRDGRVGCPAHRCAA
jgi:hypothetical protein